MGFEIGFETDLESHKRKQEKVNLIPEHEQYLINHKLSSLFSRTKSFSIITRVSGSPLVPISQGISSCKNAMPKSKHKYLPNPIRLFDDSAEEDEDDKVPGSFRPRFPQRRQSHSSDREEELERQRQLLIDKQCEIEKRTLESATRSLGLLYNSEDIGIDAAQELINQHEILKKASKTMDEMKPHLKESQKHINGINSIIYCFKNYLFGRHVKQNSRVKHTENAHSASSGSGKLSTVLNKFEKSETDSYEIHPATRLREIDHHVQPDTTRGRQVEKALEANLNEMRNVISRLKDLGLAVGEEISAQNNLIDSLCESVDETEIRVGVQTKMIQKHIN